MIDYHKNTTQLIQDILRAFPSVTQETLLQYMRKLLHITSPEGELERLIYTKQIYRDEKRFIYLHKGTMASVNDACTAATVLTLTKGNDFQIAPARYPFHRVIESEGKVYLFLDFAKQGLSRLVFEQNMYHDDIPYELKPVPLIMLINDRPSSIPESLRADPSLIALVKFEDWQIKGVNLIPGAKGEEA